MARLGGVRHRVDGVLVRGVQLLTIVGHTVKTVRVIELAVQEANILVEIINRGFTGDGSSFWTQKVV